jgi:hypothetical protein
MSNNDPYSQTQHIAAAVLDELARRTSCGVSPDVAREHGDALATLTVKMEHINTSLEEIKKMLKEGGEEFKSLNNRLTVLETQKGTAIAVLSGIGSGIALLVSSLPYIGKILKP